MKHIDTLDMQLSINPKCKKLIKSNLRNHDTSKYGKGGAFKKKHPKYPITFFYICRGCYLIVKLSHEFMVGIESADALIEKVIEITIEYFGISRDDIIENRAINEPMMLFKYKGKVLNKPKIRTRNLDLIELNRIEFKNDGKLNCSDEQLGIQDIFRICEEYSNRCYKELFQYSTRTNCRYFNDNRCYVSVVCYFKEYERLEKKDWQGATKYKNVIRTEVKLWNAHLNYSKRHRDKTVRKYFNEDVAQEYFNKYVVPIFYTEPYYRIDKATELIYECQWLPMYKKHRLVKLLTLINEVGITKARENYDAETFRKYIKQIRDLGINPLSYSRYINGKEIKVKKIKNFTLFKNSIEEDI